MLPVCRLIPRAVKQMHPGDRGAIEPWAMWEDGAGNAYLAGSALVLSRPARPGLMAVERLADGFKVDVSCISTGYKWPQIVRWSPHSVVNLVGACCP